VQLIAVDSLKKEEKDKKRLLNLVFHKNLDDTN